MKNMQDLSPDEKLIFCAGVAFGIGCDQRSTEPNDQKSLRETLSIARHAYLYLFNHQTISADERTAALAMFNEIAKMNAQNAPNDKSKPHEIVFEYGLN